MSAFDLPESLATSFDAREALEAMLPTLRFKPADLPQWWAAVEAMARSGLSIPRQMEPLANALLRQGHSMPVEVGAWVLSRGGHDILQRLGQQNPGFCPSISQIAGTYVMSSDQWGEHRQAPLHRLLDHGNEGANGFHETIDALLKTPGVDWNVRDEDGRSPLSYACSIAELTKIIVAGGNPLQQDHRFALPLDKALGHSNPNVLADPAHTRVLEEALWSACRHDDDRRRVLWCLAGHSVLELSQRWMHRCGWTLEDVLHEQVTLAPTFNTDVEPWSWTAWLSYHSLIGIRPSASDLLEHTLPALQLQRATLDDQTRIWLATVAHHASTNARMLSSSWSTETIRKRWREALKPWLDDARAQQAGLAAHELPLKKGGVIRYRALQAWLTSAILADPQAAAQDVPLSEDASRWVVRLLRAHIQGDTTVQPSTVRALQEHVLLAAGNTRPEKAKALRLPVWWAMTSAIESAADPNASNLPASLDKLTQWFEDESIDLFDTLGAPGPEIAQVWEERVEGRECSEAWRNRPVVQAWFKAVVLPYRAQILTQAWSDSEQADRARVSPVRPRF